MKFILEVCLGVKKLTRGSFHVFIDILILYCCFFIAVIINGKSDLLSSSYSLLMISGCVFLAIFILLVCGFYKIVIKYVTLKAAIPVALSITLSSLSASIFSVAFGTKIGVSDIFIYALLSLLSILGVRLLYRDVIARKKNLDETRVLIYGAGEAGRQLLNSLSSAQRYRPMAFIDDKKELHGLSVGGLRVFAPESSIELVSKYDIDLVVLAIPSISLKKRKEILIELQDLESEIRIIPGLTELMSNSIDTTDVRPICINDILGRESVPPNEKLMFKAIKKKIIMVTGAGGSIGSEICRQIIISQPAKLILFEISEFALYLIYGELNNWCADNDINVDLIPIIGNVQDSVNLTGVFKKYSVTTVFHAAAYKHVPLIESNIVEGVKNNVFGTKKVVDAAIEGSVSLVVFVSTDKAVRPTNIMGATKRMSEFICSSVPNGDKTVISMVRFGNVLGSSGSVVPLFEKQIMKGGPVTVTHPEVTRYFMTISEAAQLVIQASAMAKGGEIYLLDMGDPVKIVDLAYSMIKLHGKVPIMQDDPHHELDTEHIPITFTGLRSGEKLYEELLVNNSSVRTEHHLIMSAVESCPDLLTVNRYLKLLKTACDENDLERIRKILVDVGTGLQHFGDIGDVF
jgi:FlaA1/EpsC-like NDP-sugar epimerase